MTKYQQYKSFLSNKHNHCNIISCAKCVFCFNCGPREYDSGDLEKLARNKLMLRKKKIKNILNK